MTDSERRHGTSLSGWCMTLAGPGRFDCEHCQYAGCPHECHANVVGNQRDSWDNRGTTEGAPKPLATTSGLAPTPHYRKEA